MAKCVLYDRECINCFECDERCELDVNKICDNCKGKKECLSDVDMMQSYLIKNTSVVTREYYDCSYKSNLTGNGLDILYFPEQMKLDELYVNDKRVEIINAIQEYKSSDGTKGIYLYGPFGTGKTFILLSLANFLATNGISKAPGTQARSMSFSSPP